MDKEKFIQLLEELVESQREKLLRCAREIVGNVTPEDILQPNDYPELDNHPYFRYEEGVLEGLLTVRMAALASYKEKEGIKKRS